MKISLYKVLVTAKDNTRWFLNWDSNDERRPDWFCLVQLSQPGYANSYDTREGAEAMIEAAKASPECWRGARRVNPAELAMRVVKFTTTEIK